MKIKKAYSRRDFFKTSAIASTAAVGVGGFQSCSKQGYKMAPCPENFPVISSSLMRPGEGYTGLLYSQIGYEAGYPVRVILRMPGKDLLSENAECKLVPYKENSEFSTGITYWGEIWNSHWWVADFGEINEEGKWLVEVSREGDVLMNDHCLEIANEHLWKETYPYASANMLERRAHFTKVGAGWQDAGTLWVESCAQSAMIIALEELVMEKNKILGEDFLPRIYKQITVGSDYLVMLRSKARELGYPEGAMSHDLHGHEKDILPGDALKAVIALYRAVRVLPDSFNEKKEEYLETARLTYKWLTEKAGPMGDYGFSYAQRGLTENTKIPENEFQTRKIMLFCWMAVERWKTEKANLKGNAKDDAVRFARKIMDRQVSENDPENGFYGHFYEYDSLKHSEKAWSHGIVNNEFGTDLGGFYPNYLMPFIDMLEIWPDHEDTGKWKTCLENFTYGYLVPACNKNPFRIIPLGIFGGEGPIWFAGPFHGTNTIYGFTSALAFELSDLFDDSELRNIAYANLQWLAGLNAGITRDNLKAAVIFSTDIPEGVALPASMMCDVGHRSAGSWFCTRGVICNGFSTGKQFQMDVPPIRKNDQPESFTDEDWIPHSAGWLTGLVRV